MFGRFFNVDKLKMSVIIECCVCVRVHVRIFPVVLASLSIVLIILFDLNSLQQHHAMDWIALL